jgi:CBS domain containing-hemolysin-like protein
LLVVVEKISGALCGIVTTEDILEELLQDEIVGDDDQWIDDGNQSSHRPGLARQNSKFYDPLVLMRQLSPRRGLDIPPEFPPDPPAGQE